MRTRFLTTAFLGLACLTAPAFAVPFTLNASSATFLHGNSTSAFFQVTGSGTESGTAAPTFSSTLSGQGPVSAHDPWTIEVFFNGPQPTLTSAFLKAGNDYLWWSSADLTPFNSGVYTSILLVQDGILNQPGNAYLGVSHAGLHGSFAPTDTTAVPDGGSIFALFCVVLLGMFSARRFLKK